jgi:galactonate dehydratase
MAIVLAAPGKDARVKVTTVETFLVAPRWLFCRIGTDEGVVGWGEPVVEGRAATVRTCVEELAELIIGTDPLRTEDHWQVLTKAGFYRGGAIAASAVAGIDQALWDIAGKVRGVPVHELLGGPVRDKVRVYSWVDGDEPAEVADAIADRMAAGFTAVKMTAGNAMTPVATFGDIQAVVDRAVVARETLGPHGDFAIDFHGRLTRANAIRLLPLLVDAAPFFVEEALLPEESHLFSSLQGLANIPLATGERLLSRQEFLPVLQAGISVAQPDLSHAGGVSEVRRIASLAEVFGAHLAPHCPLGPIALAASLQVDFAIPNFLIQEQSLDIHESQGNSLLDYLLDPAVFAFKDGYVARPTGPGLGIEVDEAAVRRANEDGHRWRAPVWRHADGSFAEW